MNIVSDPKSIPAGTILSPEANQAAALATATGVLTVDLDAIVANWRKLEKAAVPAECAAVIKADAYGCGVDPVARALAAANRQARDAGFDVDQSLISINQRLVSGGWVWRISYGPQQVVGRRGGDLVIDVDGADATVKQVLRGQ